MVQNEVDEIPVAQNKVELLVNLAASGTLPNTACKYMHPKYRAANHRMWISWQTSPVHLNTVRRDMLSNHQAVWAQTLILRICQTLNLRDLIFVCVLTVALIHIKS